MVNRAISALDIAWTDTAWDFETSGTSERTTSFMSKLGKDIAALLVCLAIIIGAFFLLSYERQARGVGDSHVRSGAGCVGDGRINYATNDGATNVIPISDINLQPGETANVDLFSAIKKARLREVIVAGVEFEYTTKPGSIVMSALSVSKSSHLTISESHS